MKDYDIPSQEERDHQLIYLVISLMKHSVSGFENPDRPGRPVSSAAIRGGPGAGNS